MKMAVPILVLTLSACAVSKGSFPTKLPEKNEKGARYIFALTEEEIGEMKRKTYAEVLHKPHPSREREMIANLPQESADRVEIEPPKKFVSQDGFPLISFRGGPTSLGEALGFIAGSAGYRVEWEEGVNRALPVATTFTDTPLHKAVAALLEPFGYFGVVDGKKAMVRVGLKPEVGLEEETSTSKGARR